MKKIFRKSYLLFGILLSVMIGGCYSELSDLEIGSLQWSPELGVPLVNSEFNLKDLLEADSDFFEYTTDSENTIVIVLNEDSLFSQSATDYYSLENQTLDNVPPLVLTQNEIDLFNANGQVTVNRNVNIDFPQQAGLTEILIKQGAINLQVNENFPAIVDLSLIARDPYGTDMLNYSNEFNYFANGNPESSDETSNSFNNVRLIFDGDPALGQVSLNFNILLTRVDQDLLFGANSLDLIFNFNQLEYGALYGDLSTQEVVSQEVSLPTDFFNQNGLLEDLKYEFNNPKFKLIFTNSMGLPVRFNINDFTSFRDGNATKEAVNDAIDLSAANEGSFVIGEANFNQAFKSIVNDIPESLTIGIAQTFDPDDDPVNFVLDDSYIKVGYDMEIPLDLRLSGLEIKEDIAFDGIDPEGLQNAIFKFSTVNSLPIDLRFKVDFLDADSSVLYTLFPRAGDDDLLLEGITEGEDEVSRSVFIELADDSDTEENELDFLQDVDRIGIVASVSTSNGGDDMVKISSEAAIKFNLAVQTKYNVNLD